MKSNVTERRIDGKVRTMQIAAVICSLFAAIGIAHGIHIASPESGWFIPIVAGVVAAVGFAALWHVVIGASIGMVRTSLIVSLFVAATLLTAIQLGASAQAIATAVSGPSALSAELTDKVDTFSNALIDAHTNATTFAPVAQDATIIATGLSAQADGEAAGNHGTGKGQGPKYSSLIEASQSFQAGADGLNDLLKQAADLQDQGNAELALLRNAAATSSTQQYMTATSNIGTIIGKLNSINPQPIIASTGLVMGNSDTGGINLSPETAKWASKANAVVADRKITEIPTWRPMTLGEATRNQAFKAALHGWILAGAIDILPLFFLVLAFVFSREVWLNEHINKQPFTHEGRHEYDRQKVLNMRGEDHENDQRASTSPKHDRSIRPTLVAGE